MIRRLFRRRIRTGIQTPVRTPVSAVELERLRADPDCPYHSSWPCGDCDDCDVLAKHGPDFIVPLCPGWSKCTCMRGTAGHSVAAQLEGLNDNRG